MLNLRYIKKILQDSFQFFLERLFITVSAINCKVIRNNTRRRERIKWKRANAIFLCTYIQFSFGRFIFTFSELRMFQLIHWISQLVVNHSAAWLHMGKTKVTKRYYRFFLIVYCCLCHIRLCKECGYSFFYSFDKLWPNSSIKMFAQQLKFIFTSPNNEIDTIHQNYCLLAFLLPIHLICENYA